MLILDMGFGLIDPKFRATVTETEEVRVGGDSRIN